MHESDFQVGSIILGYESVYIKESLNSWMAYDLVEGLTANEVQEIFDDDSPYAVKIEVLYEPDPTRVLEELPPGSVVVGGDHEVAIRFEQDWAISGSELWYDSAAVLDLLGNEIEVLRRGDTD